MPDNAAPNAEFAPHIPNAVKRAGARADELLRQYNAPQEQVPLEAAAPEAEPGAPQGAPGEQPQPAEAPQSFSPPPNEWEQRYLTLQGKYNAEVPQLRDQVNSLTQLVATMRMPQEGAPPQQHTYTQPSNGAARPQLGATEKDVQEYGQELIDATGRWIEPLVESRVAAIQRRYDEQLAAVTQNLQQQRTVTAQERVHSFLDNDPLLNGKWRGVNAAPAFERWLQETDPWTGQPRYALLKDAYTSGDGNRTAHFFRAFMAEQTAVRPPQPASQTPSNGAGRPRLEDYAAPGRSAGAPPASAQSSPRIWTRQDIQNLYQGKTTGRWRGRDAEFSALEADIQAAMHEGRIR